MTSNRGRSIVFYPRSYNTRGESKKHSMIGATSAGELINVKLRLDSKHEDKENAPTIKEFAKTDYFAKTPCIASEDNSPEKSEGILLLSRCTKDGVDHDKNADVYTARWAVVLSPSSKNQTPIFGLGRMEIKKDSPTVKKLTGLMRNAEHGNRAKDADVFKSQIEDPKSWSYPAIFYHPEMMLSFPSGSYDELRSRGESAIDTLTKSGIAGGFAIRARTRSNEVVKSSYREVFVRFIISESRYQNGKEAVESLIDYLEEHQDHDGCRWDIVPIKRVNTGPSSSRHYGSDNNLSFTRSMFTFDSDDEPRLAKCCARVSYFGDTDNTLLSRLYTLSEPLDHPARLDKSGHFSLTFEGEGTKLAHLPQENDTAEEIPDGISRDERMLKRGLWLLKGDIPILRTEKPEPLNPEEDGDQEGDRTPGNFEETDNKSEESQGDLSLRDTDPTEAGVADSHSIKNKQEVSQLIEGEDDSDGKSERAIDADGDSFFTFESVEGESSDIEPKEFKEGRVQPLDAATAIEEGDLAEDLGVVTKKENDTQNQESPIETEPFKKESRTPEEPPAKINSEEIKGNGSRSEEKPPLKGMAASILKKRRG